MQVSNSFSILFYPKTSDADKNGNAPLFLRITVDGKPCELNIKRKVNPLNWCPESNRLKSRGSNPRLDDLNMYLDDIKTRLHKIHGKFMTKGKPFTAIMLKNKFLNKDEKYKTLLTIYDEYNIQIEQLIGIDYSYGANRRHVRTRGHLAEFILKEYKRQDYFV